VAPGTSRTDLADGPTYRALGLTSLPVGFCSSMWAAQPAVRAHVNIDVNMNLNATVTVDLDGEDSGHGSGSGYTARSELI